MKKFILPLLISLAPIFVNAQALSCDIQINGVSFSTYDLCVGEDIVLNGTPTGGTTPYTHLWTGGGSQLSPNNNNPTTFTATTPGTYTIDYTVTDALGANCTDQIIITVYPLPNLFTSQNDTICLGECTSLTAVTFTGDALFWYVGFIGNPDGDTSCTDCPSLTIDNLCPTNDTDYYAMAVISSSGCIRTKKVTVTVCDLTVTANGSPNPICINDTSCLTATPSGCGPTYSYVWSPTNWMDNPNSATPCVWPPSNTNYCVTVTDDLTGCTASACFLVTVNPQQPPTIFQDTTICYGGCATLIASGSGNIWLWAPGGETNDTIVVCPTSTTVYTVTMTDASGCTASASAVVTVNLQLFANAGPDLWMCYGDSVYIGGTPTASGGTAPYTYNWSPSGGNVSNQWVSPTANTTYCVTVTDALGCTATDCVIVTVNPEIIVNPGSPQSLCLGECVLLGGTPTASGGTPPYTYDWSPGATLDDSTISNPNACPAVTTLYTLIVTDFVGCTASASVLITVNPNPIADAGVDQTICSGQCVNIGGSPTASGATPPYTYSWDSNPVGFTSTASNPNVCPIVTTIYCVTITDANGCTDSDCVTVTVNPSPIADAGNDTTVCQGICVVIGGSPTATGGTPGYIYQWSPAGSLNNATIANPTACPLTTTTYCVTVTDVLGCTASDCVTITVNTVTATAVANPPTLCLGECSDITATGGGTYQWSSPPGGTTATINVCPAATTTYTVTVTNNGCTASASATVTVSSINLTVIPTTNPICPPACTDITANPSGGTAPYSYSWSTGGTTQTINVCPTATTTYTVTATDANGCTQTASTTINVYTATATATPNPICNGQCTTVSATGGGTYQWNTGQTTASFIVCPTTTTTYTVTVTNGGCTMTASVTVNVTTITATAAPAPNPICLGFCTNITATGSGGTAPYSYLWSTGGTTQIINVCPTLTTTYTCTVTDANGCAGTATTTVTVITADITGAPISICAGDSALLIATGGGTYVWSNPPGGTNDSVWVTPVTTTTYTVTVTNAGCTDSAEFTVNVGVLTVNATASPTTVCAGAGTPVTLGVSLGSSYLWTSSPPDPTLAGQTTLQNPVVIPTQTTTYTVTVTSGGCTASASITVTVDDVNATAAALPASVCAGDCSTISVTITSGTGPFTYSWNTVPPQTGQTIIVCPIITTIYICTITDANSCTEIASVQVTALPLPPATVTPASQSICVGGTATITAAGGVSYFWSSVPPDGSLVGQQNNQTINVTPIVTTTYTVTVTGANLCDSVVTATVNVTAAPNATLIVTSDTICSGDCVTITASGGSNYSWSSPPGGTANPITVCPAVTTTYTVSVTQSGCTATSVANITITVIPTPTVILTSSADPSDTICSGTCVTFTATPGASSYNFFVNGISQQLGGNNTFITCTLTNPSSVYVVAANLTCSVTSNIINITVNPSPNVSTSGTNPSFCTACDGSMTANPGGGTPNYTYWWSDGQTTQTAINLCAGSYCVTVTDANGCTDFDCGNLVDPGAPLITISSSDSDNTICDDDCITFTAGGTAVIFEFFVSGVSMQGPGASNTFTYCAFSNGDQVTVEGTDAIGCSGLSNIITVTVNSLPTQFSISGGGPFCTGGCSPIGLNGSVAGVNYFLFLNGTYHGPMVPGTGSSISFGCQTDTGDYTVIAQDTTTTCQNNMFGWVTVTENPLPALFAVTGGGSFCAGDTGVPIGLSGSQALSDSISYQLIINGLVDTTILGNGSAISFGNWTIPGTYQVVATNIQTTCSDTMTGFATVTAYPIPIQYTVTGGGSYCAGGAGLIICLSDSDPGVSYQLQCNGVDVAGELLAGTGSAICFGSQTQAGNYTVHADNGAPTFCQSDMYDTVTVTINALPSADAGTDDTICQGSSTQLNASGAGVNGTYAWSPISYLNNGTIADPTATPPSTVTYWVTVTDINGCTDNDDVVVTVNPFTFPILTATDTGFCIGETVTSTICVSPAYSSYTWNTSPVQTTSCITVTDTGCYNVVVSEANGCSALSSDICIQIYPPILNAIIIPNGDTVFCQPDSVELYLNNPYYTFEWSSGSINTPSIYVTETGVYYVTVTDSFGCKDTAGPQNITVNPLPQAIISYVDQDNAAHTFDFYNNSLYSSVQSWNFGDGSPLSSDEDPQHNYANIGSFTVILTVSNNCGTDTDTALIVVHQPTSGLTENSGIYNFDLYPNPTKDIINMDFSMSDAGTISFIMYDALGQELVFDESTYMSGKQHKELNLEEFSKGVYVLKVSTNKGSFIRRIVKD